MRTGLACLVLIIAPVGGCAAHRQQTAGASQFAFDFLAAERWLAAPADRRNEAAAETAGGRIALACIPTFGPAPAEFESARADAVGRLLAEMHTWSTRSADLSGLFPDLPGTPIRVFVVATGHPDGDAYVRNIRFAADSPVLDDAGEPVVVLNAESIARTYSGSPADQARDALGVLRHESFHVLYRRYRATPAGSIRPVPRSPQGQLWELVLDEGIGHFLDMGLQFPPDGFPPGKGEAAVQRLIEALRELRSGAVPARVEALLREANQGRYWDKYGSIAGMFFAFGVHQEEGMPGLRAAIQEGPARLMHDYQRLARTSGKWPTLPDDILP